ncbi:MAG TPA: hypothetical protein DCZ95_14080, partial [Verrucomicrobia bacterium]|nr:hypothetical protein [Verrucomicrobiota bacterium]
EADPIWIAASNSYYLKAQANALFATGTPVYTETDPAWESARSTGTTFGAEIGVSGIKMMVADIRRNTNNAVIGLLAGDAWNTGAMLQLGGDEQESGDVVYGGGQVLMKNNSSRFRIRDREGWTEIADFRGDGTTYFGGSIVPGTDNVYALGNATFPWSALYVGSSTINQSYLDGLMRADGSRAFTSNLNMGGHSITNISTNSLVYTDGKSVQQKMTEADEALTMQTVTPYWFGQFVETEAWKNNTIAEDYREVEFNLLFNGYDHSTNGIVEMKLRVYARGDSDTHMRVAIRNHTDNNYCFGHNQTTNTYTPIIWWESPWITVTNCTGPKELRVNAFTDDSSKYYFIFKTYVLVRAQKRLND